MPDKLSAPIGIFGGTFDPIHFGHLRTALEVLQTTPLQQIRFIPCREPVHKKPTFANSAQRLAMLQLATAGQYEFIVDSREIDRQTPSYMVATLRSLKTDFPNTPLCLLLGEDVIKSLNTWYQWQEISKLAHIICLHRPKVNLAEHSKIPDELNMQLSQESKDLATTPAGKCYFITTTELAISATQIRQQLLQDKSVRYLLPNVVLDYIQTNQLYKIEPTHG